MSLWYKALVTTVPLLVCVQTILVTILKYQIVYWNKIFFLNLGFEKEKKIWKCITKRSKKMLARAKLCLSNIGMQFDIFEVAHCLFSTRGLSTSVSHNSIHSVKECGLVPSPYSKVTKMHDDIIKCKHFPHYWPFVREIHQSSVDSPHKGQWPGALMFFCPWANGWANNRGAGDLRQHRAHYDITVMSLENLTSIDKIYWYPIFK